VAGLFVIAGNNDGRFGCCHCRRPGEKQHACSQEPKRFHPYLQRDRCVFWEILSLDLLPPQNKAQAFSCEFTIFDIRVYAGRPDPPENNAAMPNNVTAEVLYIAGTEICRVVSSVCSITGPSITLFF
jgi:hypothetical protein